jgi:hypothetical protein
MHAASFTGKSIYNRGKICLSQSNLTEYFVASLK